MLTVVETPLFQQMTAGVWDSDERDAFIVFIAENPDAGDVIPGGTPLRKVRWSRPGRGKRGGARVIYFLRLEQGDLVLIAVYAKAKFDNLPVWALKRWKDAYDG
jgi:hypothetical protein